MTEPMHMPWVPPGQTLVLPGRGEIFYRHHRHADPSAPTLLLLHGWTASGDVQFFTAYEQLAARWSFIAPDHRGHGRGSRAQFSLEDAADDAAELVRSLGVGPVVTIGYSMGGPISLLLARRHPELVRGMVVQATALEWRATRFERARWRTLGLLGSTLRSRFYPWAIRKRLASIVDDVPETKPWVPWLVGEIVRNDPAAMVRAGRALSRYDARGFAPELRKPSAMLITTKDRLVPPIKQRALAAAINGTVREVADDHFSTITSPREYTAATVELVEAVLAAVAAERA